MQLIEPDLYQFSAYLASIDLSFHQYLLLTEEPILFHTGDMRQAAALVPQLETALGGRSLKYVFLSHFEADECGGLALVADAFPGVAVLCSETTARQLDGFGYKTEVLVKKPGEQLPSDSYELKFIGYPSEMHLWEGLLAIENRRGIFFSSDLMIRRGKTGGVAAASEWKA